MIACHECDLLHREHPPEYKGTAVCSRCNATLRSYHPDGLRRVLACELGAAFLFIVSATFPIVSMEIHGQQSIASLIGAARGLQMQGMPSVAILVFVTTIIAPGLLIGGSLYMLLPLHLGRIPPGLAFTFRFMQSARHWGMIEVFVVGVLVSIVKLAGIAKVVPDIAMWSFAALIILMTAAAAMLEPEDIWDRAAELRNAPRNKNAAVQEALS